MEHEVEFIKPGLARLAPFAPLVPGEGEVQVRTVFSGISAGTELTVFRGTNPYLAKRWDPVLRLFVEGDATFPFPVRGWGYEEVGRIESVGPGADSSLAGTMVWGIWGHRSVGLLGADAACRQTLADNVPAVSGVFARPGAIALNALLDAEAHPTETLVVFGQGVIGLLVTALATGAGLRVIAVDPVSARLTLATTLGAAAVIADPSSAAEAVRHMTGGRGADVAVEVSGNGAALHQAVRSVGLNGRVVATSFYQGEVRGLFLGEEFHHNRVQIVSSQIGAVSPRVSQAWDRDRLHHAFMSIVAAGRLDPSVLVSHTFAAANCQAAFELLSSGAPDALQVVLDFAA